MADSLAAALAELQASLPHIPKAARGQHGRYADLADLTRLIIPRLAELGLIWVTKPTLTELFSPEPKFVLMYTLTHVSTGEKVDGFYPLGTGNPQQLGSAITYARRYCLCAVTGVAPDDDDDDGQAASEFRSLRRLDPEVRADGSATFAEQTRMMTGPEPGAYREQGTAAEVTEWNHPVMDQRDEDNRLPALRAMFALYKELGVTDRDEMLKDLTDLVGRGIDSRADLSLDDLAMTVNPALRSRRDKQRAERSGKR